MIYNCNGLPNYTVTENRLYLKKITGIGDSYVSGDGVDKSEIWIQKIADRNNMEMSNLGASGESLRKLVQNERYQNIPEDSDYIVVFSGHNDVHYDITPVGDTEDIENTTFYGCLDILCKWIMNNRPMSRTLFITPTHRTQYDATPYVNAMKDVCYRYGIPSWDAYGNLGILIGGQHGVDQRTVFETTDPQYHLNALGQLYLSYKIEEQLRML